MYMHGWKLVKSEGERKDFFEKGTKTLEFCYPCGFVRVTDSAMQSQRPQTHKLQPFISFISLFS
jgi:hypothetical protein